MENLITDINKISDNSLLNPYEVAGNDVVKNLKLASNVYQVYRLIKGGYLPAINTSAGAKPRYFVKGRDLKNFIRSRVNLEIIK